MPFGLVLKYNIKWAKKLQTTYTDISKVSHIAFPPFGSSFWWLILSNDESSQIENKFFCWQDPWLADKVFFNVFLLHFLYISLSENSSKFMWNAFYFTGKVIFAISSPQPVIVNFSAVKIRVVHRSMTKLKHDWFKLFIVYFIFIFIVFTVL